MSLQNICASAGPAPGGPVASRRAWARASMGKVMLAPGMGTVAISIDRDDFGPREGLRLLSVVMGWETEGPEISPCCM